MKMKNYWNKLEDGESRFCKFSDYMFLKAPTISFLQNLFPSIVIVTTIVQNFILLYDAFFLIDLIHEFLYTYFSKVLFQTSHKSTFYAVSALVFSKCHGDTQLTVLHF